MNRAYVKKALAFTIILLFIIVSVAQSIDVNVTENNTRIISGKTVTNVSITNDYNGSLSGYVNDTYMNPIEGALVRVYFHGTYEEDFTDSSGHFRVINIPICNCTKNCTASKLGYKTEWVLLSIDENTTYDFVLTPIDSPCYPVLFGTMGENGWYVSCVTVSFVYDPEEIVELYYYFDDGDWMLYAEPFMVCEDGEHTICWYYIDKEGNQSDVECIYFKIDQTPPTIELCWEAYKENGIWYVVFTATCDDDTSGMDRVEFFIQTLHQFTDDEVPYEWIIEWSYALSGVRFYAYAYDKAGNNESDYLDSNGNPPSPLFITGIIQNPKISEEEVTFYALIAISRLGIHKSEYLSFSLTFPNKYVGYIGRYFICAIFYTYDYE